MILMALLIFVAGTIFGLALPSLFKKFIYPDTYTRVIDEGKRTVIENQN